MSTTSDPPIENTAEAHQFGNVTILEVTNLLEGWPEYVFDIPASDLPGPQASPILLMYIMHLAET